jgi:hypothetical protein
MTDGRVVVVQEGWCHGIEGFIVSVCGKGHKESREYFGYGKMSEKRRRRIPH